MVDVRFFRELFERLRQRRRAYLLDERFTTLAAFIEGCNAAVGGELLAGFREYILAQSVELPSNLVWEALIVGSEFPEYFEAGHESLVDLSDRESTLLCDRVFTLLDDFLASRENVGR